MVRPQSGRRRDARDGGPALRPDGDEDDRSFARSGTSNVLYYVTDHLGSVRVVKDGAGTAT